ncbi:MAG: MFS transporter [Planctomycetia bacterium]|nr:MAG: MFS transporter [Planctomycetia bacterium]
MLANATRPERWYDGITRYQWLVLLIASLGWIFDVFEGQIFVASMREAMPSLVPAGTAAGRIALYNNVALGAFLLGGALGGIVFGTLSDRIGRKRTMSITILFYSLFTCVSSLSQQWWHLAGLRFLVALGVGGEWAVASSMVAEVFPKRARAHVGGIFHASSVLGSYLAVAAGTFLIGNAAVHAWAREVNLGWASQFIDPASLPWRVGFALGALPALLIVWIRMSLRESESWQAARARARNAPEQKMGTIGDLFRGKLRRRTLVGVALAAIGLATFWGTHIYGKNMLQLAVEQKLLAEADRSGGRDLQPDQREAILARHRLARKRWEMLGMFLVTTGGGAGLLSFGPICQRIGRRRAFLLFHVGGLASSLLVFQVLGGVTTMLVALPVFGFLTLGMHSGYAIYFPELYPTRVRGTGTGFCFNGGRILAAPILLLMGVMQNQWGFTLPDSAALLSLLFILGVVVLQFAPETRGTELPE